MADAKNAQNAPLVQFFLLALVFALPSYILMGLTAKGFIFTPELAVAFLPLAVFAPLGAALYLNWRQGGWSAVKALLARTLDFKRIGHWVWYAIAFGLPLIIVLLASNVSAFLGLPQLPPEIPLVAVPIALAIFFFAALSEELGWMGFAFEPMKLKFGMIRSTIYLGLALMLFHVPLYYFLIEDPVLLIANLLFPLSLRVLIIWVYANTGKSIFAATVFHMVYNTCYIALSVNIPVATALSIIAAVAVVYLWGPRTMTDFKLAKTTGG